MNIPNTLTVSRVIAAVILLLLLALPMPFGKSLALLVFLLAAMTDYFDGYLARNVYGVSSFGKLMDPLADKILVCVALISFVEIQLPCYPGVPLLPAWIVVIVIAREFTVTGLRLLGAGKGKLISAGRWGKHKTVWQ
ncbi:MAG: CDP-diacylglycerol--glycerol-3-phosphate 3-phosphatidyltransferase, partial [Kiritimatiellae bacterium]|nr:CDP-diacylglycerol--glycerol-3-phosphate 3-phosphatidyltransferase [Kiritimatiellia bacterium]